MHVQVLPAARGDPARARPLCPKDMLPHHRGLQEGHLHQGQRVGEQQGPARLSFLEKLTWPTKRPIKTQQGGENRGKGYLKDLRVERGNISGFFFPPDNKFTGGPSPPQSWGAPGTGVTAEKSSFGVGFWLVGCVFIFQFGGTLPPNHAVLHLPSKYTTTSVITASTRQRFAKSHVHIWCRKPKPADINWDRIISVLLFGGKSVALVQTNWPLDFFRISTLSPCPVGSWVMKPSFILKCRQHLLIFGSPKEKFDQHAASISNSGS